MCHFGPRVQVSLYALQVFLHSGAVATLGQLVFHIALIVCHIGEEALMNVWESQYRQRKQNQHDYCGAPAMAYA